MPAGSTGWAQLEKSSQQQQQQYKSMPPVADTASGQRIGFQGFHVNSPDPLQQQPAHQQARELVKENSDTSQKSADSTFDKKKSQTVLIWDLDETLILFHSLLSGVYADHHLPLKAKEAANLGRKWQESILDLCDQHFFFTEVREGRFFTWLHAASIIYMHHATRSTGLLPCCNSCCLSCTLAG